MNITVNLSKKEVQAVIAAHIKEAGYALEDDSLVVIDDGCASVEICLDALTPKQDKPESKKRVRRTKEQIEADKAKEAADATKDKDAPKPEKEAKEKVEEASESGLDTGNIEDLEKSKATPAKTGSSSLFA